MRNIHLSNFVFSLVVLTNFSRLIFQCTNAYPVGQPKAAIISPPLESTAKNQVANSLKRRSYDRHNLLSALTRSASTSQTITLERKTHRVFRRADTNSNAGSNVQRPSTSSSNGNNFHLGGPASAPASTAGENRPQTPSTTHSNAFADFSRPGSPAGGASSHSVQSHAFSERPPSQVSWGSWESGAQPSPRPEGSSAAGGKKEGKLKAAVRKIQNRLKVAKKAVSGGKKNGPQGRA